MNKSCAEKLGFSAETHQPWVSRCWSITPSVWSASFWPQPLGNGFAWFGPSEPHSALSVPWHFLHPCLCLSVASSGASSSLRRSAFETQPSDPSFCQGSVLLLLLPLLPAPHLPHWVLLSVNGFLCLSFPLDCELPEGRNCGGSFVCSPIAKITLPSAQYLVCVELMFGWKSPTYRFMLDSCICRNQLRFLPVDNHLLWVCSVPGTELGMLQTWSHLGLQWPYEEGIFIPIFWIGQQRSRRARQ